jgi:hypothetical protein
MIRSTGLLSLILCSTIAHGVASANAPAPSLDPRQGRELVRQLGHESYPVREEASHKLLALGLAAKDILIEGARNPDPEIRNRCRKLLPAVFRADRKARLEAFIADKEGKKEHDLPGWKRYRQVAGNGAASRDFFVSLQRSGAVALLIDVERSPKQATALLQSNCQQLWMQLFFRPGLPPRPPSVPEVAALYLVASYPQVRLTPTSINQLVNFLNQPAIQTAMRGDAVALRKLTVGWMKQQIDDTTFQQIGWTLLNNNLNLPEAAEVGLNVIRQKKAKAQGLALALAVIGKHGKKEYVKELKPYLDDRSVIATMNMNRQLTTIQVRDVALAMTVHLTGQSPKDYGFPNFQQNNPWSRFHYFYMGFANDTQRDQAFRKWKAWGAAQKKS